MKNVKGMTCIANEPVGAMGVHYANPKYLGDAKLSATKPEALVYAPSKGGKLQLAALEYIVFKSAWKTRGPHGRTDALRAAVRLHAEAERVRDPGVLLASRLALADEHGGGLQAVEPGGSLLGMGDAEGRGRVGPASQAASAAISASSASKTSCT